MERLTGRQFLASAPLARRMFQVLAGLLIVLTLVAPAAQQAVQSEPQKPLPAPLIAKIDRAVTTFMASAHAPGVSVAIGLNGGLRWENGYGLADVETFVPATATASTVYRLASISKPITAVAVMQLVERRRLSLDDTAGKWVPDL